jgi:hypothetical protein
MSYKKDAPFQRKMDAERRMDRTRYQIAVMTAATEGKRVQIFAANGSWLTANYASGFGCGWNWQQSVYRVHPEDDTDRVNDSLREFYIDPSIIYNHEQDEKAKSILDKMQNNEFKSRYEREP